MKKTLVLPPWMNTIKFYHTNIHEFRVSSGVLLPDASDDGCVVGLSIGSLAVLEHIHSLKGMVILINPLVPHRSVWVWLWRWTRYVWGGLFVERQKFTLNPLRWVSAVRRVYVLATTDFSSVLATFPKERLIVIRNVGDTFFCDDTAVAYLRTHGVKVIEIPGGHNWNVYVEDEMNTQIENASLKAR